MGNVRRLKNDIQYKKSQINKLNEEINLLEDFVTKIENKQITLIVYDDGYTFTERR